MEGGHRPDMHQNCAYQVFLVNIGANSVTGDFFGSL